MLQRAVNPVPTVILVLKFVKVPSLVLVVFIRNLITDAGLMAHSIGEPSLNAAAEARL